MTSNVWTSISEYMSKDLKCTLADIKCYDVHIHYQNFFQLNLNLNIAMDYTSPECPLGFCFDY